MAKSSVSQRSIEQFIRKTYGGSYRADSLTQLVEGLESQAFTFSVDDYTLVLRLNADETGFQKDLCCYRSYHDNLPIPEIIDIGQFDEETSYCVSQWARGKTLQALSETDLEGYLKPTFDLLLAIRGQSISQISGYGTFDSQFMTAFSTWHDFLHSVILPEKTQYREIYAEYERLLPFCSERRELLHGDFGSNNVLVANGKISAIIDWDCAMIGDYLMDVAGAYFWSYHLNCMAKQAEFYEVQLSHLEDHYHEKICCYQLMLGLRILHEYALEADAQTIIEARLDDIMANA